jgi:GT2 family glycosyltransferase
MSMKSELSELSVSVLIPTWGRSKELISLLSHLTRQSVIPKEIIVVDQNDPEIGEVSQYLKTIPYAKHFKSVPKGLVAAYNLCAKKADGDILLFVDDDVSPPNDLIERHLANYIEDTAGAVGGVAGRVRNAFGDTEARDIIETGKYHKWSGAQTSCFNGLSRVDCEFAQGANMSYRKSVFEKLGGFDSQFQGNGYFFETDFGLRLIKQGYKMIFDPQADVYHLMAESGGARIKDKALHTYYFIANGIKIYRKHSPSVGLPFFLLKQISYSLLKAGYNLDPRIFFMGIKGVFSGMKRIH